MRIESGTLRPVGAPAPERAQATLPRIISQLPAPTASRPQELLPLDGAFETKTVRANKGAMSLVPYGGNVDPARPPVVLVHGFASSPAALQQIADRLAKDGMQVYFAVYEDSGTRIRHSGRQLAQLLQTVKETHADAGELRLVAHSMGGLVCRAALNELEHPTWLQDNRATRGRAPTPRAGFDSVRFQAIDTPWDGIRGVPTGVRYVPTLEAGMRLIGWSALSDLLSGNSVFFRRLFDRDLAGVTQTNHNVRQESGAADAVRSYEDLDDATLRRVAQDLKANVSTGNRRLHAFEASVRGDARYPMIKACLDELDVTACDRATLIGLFDAVMPRELGTHSGVLTDPAFIDALTHQDAFER